MKYILELHIAGRVKTIAIEADSHALVDGVREFRDNTGHQFAKVPESIIIKMTTADKPQSDDAI